MLNEIFFCLPLACKMFISGRLQPTELPLTLIRNTTVNLLILKVSAVLHFQPNMKYVHEVSLNLM